ncbi:unnamed protein product [Arctia plantaginis]|uniref:Uncharacterized protein n=1 Tax=Arctia plantaginis TaxID=874455 RepID=A0A8S1A3B5_ARCPL|nr:unnamed protein product [Arctia plantaginis]CAB3240408.1 unnamed protein product [Arctia plantaginis]
MENNTKEIEFEQINQVYDECLNYLKTYETEPHNEKNDFQEDPDYDTIAEKMETVKTELREESKPEYKLDNEKSRGSIDSVISDQRSERLRKLSKQLPKIIITQSNTSLNTQKPLRYNFVSNLSQSDHSIPKSDNSFTKSDKSFTKSDNSFTKSDFGLSKSDYRLTKSDRSVPKTEKELKSIKVVKINGCSHSQRVRHGYASEYPKRLVSKTGMENVAMITNVPFENIRLLNDTFHTLINLRWRWIVTGTIVVHFAIWLVFAVFWYIAALAHYDFEPDPPKRTCVTGGKDFVTIFLASVEAQTTIGFGDRAIDEECPESIFLFIMQLILGTGLSGVLTCVVYAKLTRPEKLSRDGVGFSKKAVISMRDGQLCLMMRAWDLNYDHIISSEFTAHFINTYRTKEGEVIRYYARSLALQQRQFLLWPVTLVHVIDASSPLYGYTPELIAGNSYEITVSLKGASASMGTFTQSQTSYVPREVVWGYRFPPVVKYDFRKQKYVIDDKKLDLVEPVDTPFCCAKDLHRGSTPIKADQRPQTPSNASIFSETVASFHLERTSSFRKKTQKTFNQRS